MDLEKEGEKMAEDTKELSSYSAAEMLAEVNKAIVAITAGGQSYKIGSRSLTRANITELRNLRDTLTAEVAATTEQNGLFADTYVAEFMGPR